MQANSRGAARCIPAWVMWVQIIWKVLFPKEFLLTAFSAGIVDQIKAPGCVPSPLLGCVFTADVTDVGWICHICTAGRGSLHITGWGSTHGANLPPKNDQGWDVGTGWGVPALLVASRLSWALVLSRSVPLQQRRTDKQSLETMTKY